MLDRARARLSQIVAAPFRSLLGKYIAYFIAALGVPLVGYTLMGVWLASVEQRTALVEVQRAKTASAAIRISTFVHDIEGQLRFLTQLGWGYALLRIAHSLVQVTVNITRIRFLLFFLASLCLLGLVVLALVHLF